MHVIVELVNRAHKVIERHSYNGNKCRIGRAFDNDIILSEAHVSPFHAELTEDQHGNWWLRDLESKNGLLNRRHKQLVSPVQIHSGDELIIGKVHLKFYRFDHEVEDAVGLGVGENLIYTLSQPLHFCIFAFAAIGFFTYVEFLQSYNEIELKEFLPTALGTPAIGLVWAGMWALAGRVLRHEPRFIPQVIIAFTYLIAIQLTEVIIKVISYNSGEIGFSTTMVYLVNGVLATMLISYNLRLASHQPVLYRNLSASAVAWGLVGMIWLVSAYSKSSFRNEPLYISTLLPPVASWSEAVDVEQFQRNADFIFADDNSAAQITTQ